MVSLVCSWWQFLFYLPNRTFHWQSEQCCIKCIKCACITMQPFHLNLKVHVLMWRWINKDGGYCIVYYFCTSLSNQWFWSLCLLYFPISPTERNVWLCCRFLNWLDLMIQFLMMTGFLWCEIGPSFVSSVIIWLADVELYHFFEKRFSWKQIECKCL